MEVVKLYRNRFVTETEQETLYNDITFHDKVIAEHESAQEKDDQQIEQSSID